MTIEVPAIVAEGLAGAVVSVVSALVAAVKILWTKVSTLEAKFDAQRAEHDKEKAELTARWIAEVRARVRDYNAPPPAIPTAPPAPEEEPTGVHNVRKMISDQELDADLERYVKSTKFKGKH